MRDPGDDEDIDDLDDRVYYHEQEDEGIHFANPGSALRAATPDNPRDLPCPTCGEANRLTPADVALGYQCDTCADRAEGKYIGGDY